MPVIKNSKHKEYAQYAMHCLNMVVRTKDQDARALIREMAAEWLKLADTALDRNRSGGEPQLAFSHRFVLPS
jgi:hypothetical protein